MIVGQTDVLQLSVQDQLLCVSMTSKLQPTQAVSPMVSKAAILAV